MINIQLSDGQKKQAFEVLCTDFFKEIDNFYRGKRLERESSKLTDVEHQIQTRMFFLKRVIQNSISRNNKNELSIKASIIVSSLDENIFSKISDYSAESAFIRKAKFFRDQISKFLPLSYEKCLFLYDELAKDITLSHTDLNYFKTMLNSLKKELEAYVKNKPVNSSVSGCFGLRKPKNLEVEKGKIASELLAYLKEAEIFNFKSIYDTFKAVNEKIKQNKEKVDSNNQNKYIKDGLGNLNTILTNFIYNINLFTKHNKVTYETIQAIKDKRFREALPGYFMQKKNHSDWNKTLNCYQIEYKINNSKLEIYTKNGREKAEYLAQLKKDFIDRQILVKIKDINIFDIKEKAKQFSLSPNYRIQDEINSIRLFCINLKQALYKASYHLKLIEYITDRLDQNSFINYLRFLDTLFGYFDLSFMLINGGPDISQELEIGKRVENSELECNLTKQGGNLLINNDLKRLDIKIFFKIRYSQEDDSIYEENFHLTADLQNIPDTIANLNLNKNTQDNYLKSREKKINSILTAAGYVPGKTSYKKFVEILVKNAVDLYPFINEFTQYKYLLRQN